MDFFFPDWKT